MSYNQNTNLPSMTIFCDSRTCISREPYIYNLIAPIKCPLAFNMVISVENVVFPNTFFNVTSFNNSITFAIGSVVPIPQTTITFPEGLYSVYQFKNYFDANNAYNMTMIIGETDLRIRFICNQIFSIVSATCGNLIGLPLNSSNETDFPIISTADPPYTIRMTRSFNFSGGSFVFLKADNMNFYNVNSSGIIDNTMARIPINATQGQMVNYRPTETLRMVLQRKEIGSFRFNLVDTLGNTINVDELQILVRIDFIALPDDENPGKGSIDYYYKENGMPDENIEEREEESKQVGV